MDYFYCTPENISKKTVIIDGEEFSHLTHVMRKKAGDEIRVVDGLGTAYDVSLTEIKKKAALGIILKSYPNHNEPNISVTLAVGILKNPYKFDFLVEKVTEIGVREIIPLLTERTITKHAKVDRWQKLAIAAMKQCGRSYLPLVRELTTLSDLLKSNLKFDINLIAHQESELSKPFQNISVSTQKFVLILIGPEGGFSDNEFEKCIANGFKHLYLGNRRLRTETAAILASGLVLFPNISN